MASHSEDDDHLFQWRHLSEMNPSNLHAIMFLLLFFGVVILMPAFFLLLHLCCRHRLNMASPSPAHPHDDDDDHKIEISMVRASLGNYNHHKKTNNMECCICLSEFKEQEKVKVLPQCEHAYHSHCVDTWLRLTSHPTCPLCRASLHNFICIALQ